MSAKETPWYDGKVKPVRVGVYKRRSKGSGEITYSKWNGRWWLNSTLIVNDADKQAFHSIFQRRQWCGLAEDPYAGEDARDERFALEA